MTSCLHGVRSTRCVRDRRTGVRLRSFCYGFDDLTPIELDAVETLSRLAEAAVTVSLTYEPDRPALAARATVVEELRAGADVGHGSCRRWTTTTRRALAVALHQLERGLFEPEPPAVEPGDAVTLMEAGGERAEAELVAAEVLAALAAGVPAREIVVVCRSLSRSGEVLERALERARRRRHAARGSVPLAHTATRARPAGVGAQRAAPAGAAHGR